MKDITRCVRWKESLNVPFPYSIYVEEEGYYYSFDKCRGRWERSSRTGWSVCSWEPCSPLEVVVVCGIKGLE